MKKWGWIGMIGVLASLLSGCFFGGGAVTGGTYEDAVQYRTGAFTYQAAEVREVRVNWHSGSVTLKQTGGEQLSVSESGANLTEEKALHWLLQDGVLYVEFCASGYSGQFSGSDKRLTVEVPEGLTIAVTTTSAGISADLGKQKQVLLQSTSGTIEVGSVTAEEVRLETTSGGIHAELAEGERVAAISTSGAIKLDEIRARETVRLTSTSGGIQVSSLSAVGGEVEAGNSSGGLRIGSLCAARLSVGTTSGSVTVGVAECDEISVGTTSGSVRLELAQGFGATVSVSSTSGSFNGSGYKTESGRSYVWGDGACAVRIRTTSGSITVK